MLGGLHNGSLLGGLHDGSLLGGLHDGSLLGGLHDGSLLRNVRKPGAGSLDAVHSEFLWIVGSGGSRRTRRWEYTISSSIGEATIG